MILCLNSNAAIDKTVVINRFCLNEIHRPLSVLALPGGKGANVAKGLKCLGESPLVSGWVGGFNGRFIETGLQQAGIQTSFVHVGFESRTCLSILDPEYNTLTEVYERGDPLPSHKITELLDLFASLVPSCSAVTLSGSLPPAVPADFYAQLINIAAACKIPVFLDSSGEPLKQGIELARPYLIKPNAREFAGLMEITGSVGTSRSLPEKALILSRQKSIIVAVSLGADGLLVADKTNVFQVKPPAVAARSAVGSGDCLMSGLAYGITHGF